MSLAFSFARAHQLVVSPQADASVDVFYTRQTPLEALLELQRSLSTGAFDAREVRLNLLDESVFE
ncbi:MAG: type II secretion system protein GspE, partial [Gammaproteobacteria bacterium]|nr:type II secretion system protein GspE [Gammaproteobacteria bacterium]